MKRQWAESAAVVASNLAIVTAFIPLGISRNNIDPFDHLGWWFAAAATLGALSLGLHVVARGPKLVRGLETARHRRYAPP